MVKVPLIGRLVSLVRGAPADARPAVAERNQRMRTSLDHAPLPIAFAAADGRWLQTNEQFRGLLGYSREELARINFRSITHPEDASVEAPLLKALLGGNLDSYRMRKRVIDKKGHYRTVDLLVAINRNAAGQIESVMYVGVGGRHRHTDTVYLGERTLAGSIYQITDIAVISSDQDGLITGWNAGAQRLLGYRREEVLGKPASLIRPAGEDQTDHETAEADEFRVTKSGSRISVHSWSQAVKLAEGEGFLEIIVPVVEGAAIDTRRIVSRLRKELGDERKTSEALRQSLAQLRAVGEETLNELKVMAAALRKEIDRRKSVEQELQELQTRLAALSTSRAGTAPSMPADADHAEELAGDPRARRWARFEDPRALTEILKDLGRKQQSGTLVVESDGMLSEIALDAGSVVSTATNSPDAFLTQRLVASGALSDEQRQRVLEVKQHTQLSLGRILLILGAVSEEQLIEAMSKKIADDVARVRAWPSGRWCFEERASDTRQAVPLRIDIGALLGIEVRAEEERALEKARPALVVPEVDSGEWVIDVTAPVSVQADAPIPAEEPVIASSEVVAATPAAPASPRAAPMRLIASSNAKKFHRESCKSVRRIEDSVRLVFDSEVEAARRGLKPCRLCITPAVEETVGSEAMSDSSMQATAKSVVH